MEAPLVPKSPCDLLEHQPHRIQLTLRVVLPLLCQLRHGLLSTDDVGLLGVLKREVVELHWTSLLPHVWTSVALFTPSRQ